MLPTNRFTPATIGDLKFSIPLYQRLFEWEEPQINQLLNDLYSSFEQDAGQPYYIGMLTALIEDSACSLVDGQQRFTVLTLMAIAFDTNEWKAFVKINGVKHRLVFFARNNDEEYLRNIFEKRTDLGYVNIKMRKAIETIRNFAENKVDGNKDSFAKYVYEKATFFISELPDCYTAQDLNRYFEAMNGTGKGLENHEILKVNLLKKLPNNRVHYTKIWNLVSEMDKCLMRQNFKIKENIEAFKVREKAVLIALSTEEELLKYCNISIEDAGSFRVYKSIKEIEISSKSPVKKFTTRNERAILTFPEFLLQVLWLQLSADERKKTNDFFNVLKLQENFERTLKSGDEELFMNNLLKYRIIFDYYILRINHSDASNVSYFLNFTDGESQEEDGGAIGKQLIQFQSMLYVSTATHRWVTEILDYLAKKPYDIKALELLGNLKEQDNARCNFRHCASFKYGSIDRYWFWRLDYFLWENRSKYFNDKALVIAGNYVFRANRSIEHIAPQKPLSNSNVEISVEYLNSFGNLSMISSGQNSSLQNESFEVKRAHVESFINGSKNGSIESLKMLFVYETKTWNEHEIKLHSNNMIDVLSQSFRQVAYSEIAGNLEKIKFKISNDAQPN